MIPYIFETSNCEYTHKLEIKNKEQTVNLNHIDKKRTLNINDIELDIKDYNYAQCKIDRDDYDLLIISFYTYNDYGDSGMDLNYETQIMTKLSKLEKFIIL